MSIRLRSAVGEREKWSGERRDGGNEAGAQRRRRDADGSPALLRQSKYVL